MTDETTKTLRPPVADVPGGALAALAVLGALALALSSFLWWQLVVSRAGGTPLCGFGEEGACGALWDAAFATSVHQATGVPVAGWGAIWALAAMLIPLGVLWNARHDPETVPAWRTAIRWTALGGLAAVVVLAVVSFGEGIFCAGCLASYGLVLTYVGIAFYAFRNAPWSEPLPAGWIVFGLLGAGYVLAFYPGLRTPPSGTALERQALQSIVDEAGETDSEAATEAQPPSPGRATTVDTLLRQFFDDMDPESRQLVADALYVYENTEPRPTRPSRFVIGSTDAPVRLTDFTDPLCPACADLHYNLGVFFRALPEGTFSIEPRHFPLDGRCNSLISQERDGLRCLAAKAQICMEGRPEAFDFSSRIFENQQELTREKVYELAAPYLERSELETCIDSAETARKLEDDIRYAADRGISGTPLLLFNDRKSPGFGPFLYGMILTGGDPDHPVFDDLPPPRDEIVERVGGA